MLGTYEFLSSKHLCVEVSLREVPERPLSAPGGCKFSLDRVQLVVDILTNYVFETMLLQFGGFSQYFGFLSCNCETGSFLTANRQFQKQGSKKIQGASCGAKIQFIQSIVVIVSNPSVPNNKISIRIHFQEVRIPTVCKTWNIFLTIFESFSI